MKALYSWGAGTSGQLGQGIAHDSYLPVQTKLKGIGDRRPVCIACGGSHAIVAFDDEGSCWAWGAAVSTTGEKQCLLPSPVTGLAGIRVIKVAAGWAHTAYVTDTGRLLTAGEGNFGQLGIGTLLQAGTAGALAEVGGPLAGLRVVDVAAGMRHTLAVAALHGGDGHHEGRSDAIRTGTTERETSSSYSLFSFGSNNKGQLGLSGAQALIRKQSEPCIVESVAFEESPLMVSAGGDNSAVIDAAGVLLVWGRCGGADGQGAALSSPAAASDPLDGGAAAGAEPEDGRGQEAEQLRGARAVACGWRHNVALDSEGAVWAWGSNQHLQCGSGADDGEEASPAPSFQQLVSRPRRVPFLRGVHCSSISAGSEHSVAVSSSGQLFAWGWAEHGQLGAGDDSDQGAPCAVRLPGPALGAWCGSGFTAVMVAIKSRSE